MRPLYHSFRCKNCGNLILFTAYDEIPDDDLDLVGNPGNGSFKAYYTCPTCKGENRIICGVEIKIVDWEWY